MRKGGAYAGTTGTKGFRSPLEVAPALQRIVSERALLEASVQLPVFQDMNGRQLTPDERVLVGFRFVY